MKGRRRPETLDEHEFNHALYHHLGHWAAYVAMMGLLATFALVIALSPAPVETISTTELCIRGVWAVGAIFVVAGFAVFFAGGMDRYGRLLHIRLGTTYLDYTLHWKHDTMIRMEKFAAVAAAVFDIGLLVLLGLRYRG